MESDMKCIAEGTRTKQQVQEECISEMKKIFMKTTSLEQQFKKFFWEKFR